MPDVVHTELQTPRGAITVYQWEHPDPSWIAVLVHGYGEHLGRYEYVAERLHADGAHVVGPDHQGHGRSEGERVVITDYETVVDDLQLVVEQVRSARPGVPVVLVGHSMGGMIGTRYAQRYGDQLRALVLSGPVLGSWAPTGMLELDEIPDDPLDITTLSRDAEVGEVYAADPLVWHGPFRRETLRALVDALDTIARGGDLGTLPTLWLHGADDTLVPIEPTRAGLEVVAGSDLTEVIFPGARHEVFNETNRDEVLATVTSFVQSHLG